MGGVLSVIGAYAGLDDKIPNGAMFNKALTVRNGQCNVQRYWKELLEKIESGAIDPSFVITHPMRLQDAPEAYKRFTEKKDGCIKVVLKP